MKLFVISRVRLIEISINLLIMVFIITTLIHKLEIYQLNFINQPLLVALGLTISFFIGISMKKEPLILTLDIWYHHGLSWQPVKNIPTEFILGIKFTQI